ncbi:AAA-ATPase At3g50940-like [Humulus lupulus]|uniref:AAA-ATPase At3g50940-like n=1 Tax=Humulus lupulus TaxID=3486 RepID=UPI002B414631|nr:AAA-ATPase At3g50940-like [Humulus lupulus]
MVDSSSSSAETKLATAKMVLSTAASVAATAMLVRSLVNDFMPDEIQVLLFSGIRNFLNRFSSQMTMVLDEFDGLVNNEIYEAAEVYLGEKVSPSTQRLKVSKAEKEKNFTVAMERGETIVDVFNGVKFTWILVCRHIESKNFYNPRDLNSTLRSEVRSFELSFHKKHLDMVLKSYLPHILTDSKSVKQEKKTLKIFTVDYENIYNIADAWMPTNLDHPATFETLAMDSEIKNFILDDLERFVRRKDYYRKVGKAWKRGYLLYGPPGTGKSSLIAAMANYLNFDVYDLELSELRVNSDLRKLLIAMANRSILVVEDIDCSVNFDDRNKAVADSSNPHATTNEKQVTLSGLLNFIDGLWSSCGDERIIIFTTNHKERLDPALLRPGRMDVHLHMSYCTPGGFRLLASNYLGVKHHPLFEEIEQQLKSTEVTPAEVAEELIKSDDPEAALGGLVEFLKVKKKENEEAKLKKEKEEDEKDVAKAESLAKEENGTTLVDTEADVAEELVKGDHLEVALQGIVDLLKVRKKENGKAKVEKEKQREEAGKENGKAKVEKEKQREEAGKENGIAKDVEAESEAEEVKSSINVGC